MAGKQKRMSQVKQILRMHLQGQGIKTLARALSVSKNTVKDYIGNAKYSEIPVTDLLELEDPALEAKLWPGNPSYKDQRFEHLKEHLEYYSKELKKGGVNRMCFGKSITLIILIRLAMPNSVITCSIAGAKNLPWL